MEEGNTKGDHFAARLRSTTPPPGIRVTSRWKPRTLRVAFLPRGDARDLFRPATPPPTARGLVSEEITAARNVAALLCQPVRWADGVPRLGRALVLDAPWAYVALGSDPHELAHHAERVHPLVLRSLSAVYPREVRGGDGSLSSLRLVVGAADHRFLEWARARLRGAWSLCGGQLRVVESLSTYPLAVLVMAADGDGVPSFRLLRREEEAYRLWAEIRGKAKR